MSERSSLREENIVGNNVQAGPLKARNPEQAKTRTLANLRQMTWEATQFLSFDEVREFVEGVLREVESDEP